MSEKLALHWRLIPQRYALIGTECKTCNQKYFPARQLCPNCRRKGEIAEFPFSGKGEVYSHTIIHSPPKGYEYQKPYSLAIVKLVEGPFITSQIVECDPAKVKIGDKVETVFRKVIADGEEGIIRYAYKFRLVKGK